MFFVIFFKKSIKSIVAKAKATIAFFMHLHFVIIRDIRNVRNIIKRKTGRTR